MDAKLLVALRRINRAISLHSRALQNEFGLTLPQLAALDIIGRHAPVTTGTVAREMHLGYATVTGILDRLERDGMIERWRGEHDRRSVLIALTDKSRETLSRTPSLLQTRFHQKFSTLPDWEQMLIVSTLVRVAEMMDQDEDDDELLTGAALEGEPT